MEGNLLKEIISISETAANIARICRQDEHLLRLLTQEKNEEEKNQRFLTDFKTLADVLIQEVVKFHLSSRFPLLEGNIHGEESNTFTNATGESITLNVSTDPANTREALLVILNGNQAAVESLLEAVYTEPKVPLTEEELEQLPFVMSVTEDTYGVWIDPIDSTAEYISGNPSCALVLIGVYNKSDGTPVLGVVNQPFHEETAVTDVDCSRGDAPARSWRGRVYWGVCSGEVIQHCDLPRQDFKRQTPIIAVSSSERSDIRDHLLDSAYELLPLPGAGYKLLSVILNQCDLYLCSKPSTFVWDTLACHAILKSLGGSVVQCRGSEGELKYNEGRCNTEGVLAYRHEMEARRVLKTIEKLIER